MEEKNKDEFEDTYKTLEENYKALSGQLKQLEENVSIVRIQLAKTVGQIELIDKLRSERKEDK